jgi:hypothetical protein
MTSDLWDEAFQCARRARNIRELLQDGTGIGADDRKALEKLASELEQGAALLKAHAAASRGPRMPGKSWSAYQKKKKEYLG